MIYYVSCKTGDEGNGTKETPFRTISQAAEIAAPGDTILVGPGMYREAVDPKNGGSDEEHRIIYRAEKKGTAVISGAEPVKNWEQYHEEVWVCHIENSLFGSSNPYTTYVQGDWYLAPDPVHTGEVYLNGKSMYESKTLEGVLVPKVYKASWDPEFTVYKWYTEQKDGNTAIYANFHGKNPNEENVEINVRRSCFYPSKEGIGYITLSGFTIKQAATQWAPPTAYQEGMIGPHWSKGWIIEDCEVSDSKCSGISLGKYLQPDNNNKWSTKFLKDGTQTERDAICQAQTEGWMKEKIGSHIIRRCNIHDCGQTGIVGHLGGVFSVIEDNHIHHINNKQDLEGAEIGGIKMHAAIDVIYRRNHIHHCTRGMWLDWQAQGTRVTQNFFHDNTPPEGTQINGGLCLGEDIFVEVSHGPTLIDNNIMLSACAGRLSTQGLAFVHNLIAGSFTFVDNGTDNRGKRFSTPRYTPYHMPHRTEIAGFMTILHGDARFLNNIFVQQEVRSDLRQYAETSGMGDLHMYHFTCGTKPYDGFPTPEQYFSQFTAESSMDGNCTDIYYDHLPVYTGGNVYFNGAQPCNSEKAAQIDTEHTIRMELIEKNGGYTLETNLFQYLKNSGSSLISTEDLGMAFEPEEKFESPDGSSIVFDTDYFGDMRNADPICGPFAKCSTEIAL